MRCFFLLLLFLHIFPLSVHFLHSFNEHLMKMNINFPAKVKVISLEVGIQIKDASALVSMSQVYNFYFFFCTFYHKKKSLLGCKESDRKPWLHTRQRKDYSEALAPQRDHWDASACFISHIPWFGWICWCNLLSGMSDSTREPTGRP